MNSSKCNFRQPKTFSEPVFGNKYFNGYGRTYFANLSIYKTIYYEGYFLLFFPVLMLATIFSSCVNDEVAVPKY
jgi:hypothetical protein